MAERHGSSGDGTPPSLVEKLLGSIAALCLFCMMALTFATVIARYFLNRPIAGDSELQAFLLGLIIFSAIPLVTRAERHIAVRSLAAMLKGRALLIQRGFVLALTSLGFAFIAYLIFLQGQTLWEENTRSNYLNVPEAPFAYFFAFLALIAALIAAGLLLRLFRAAEDRHELVEVEANPE
jgi:TRAP-type transport system small permease protein